MGASEQTSLEPGILYFSFPNAMVPCCSFDTIFFLYIINNNNPKAMVPYCSFDVIFLLDINNYTRWDVLYFNLNVPIIIIMIVVEKG